MAISPAEDGGAFVRRQCGHFLQRGSIPGLRRSLHLDSTCHTIVRASQSVMTGRHDSILLSFRCEESRAELSGDRKV